MTGLIVAGAVALVAILLYNRVVVLKNRCDNAWSQIDVQLKRRADLIPNLVETVKGYAAHEKDTLEKVMLARASLVQGGSVAQTAQAHDMLSGALKSLFAVTENYPQLKADKNFQMLQEELDGTESKIAYARQFYNDTVMDYNTKLRVFPSNLIAGFFRFTEQAYFNAPEQDREAPKVKF
ncbi:MAG TPA: LemA family protein [Nitrososphaera sp.]|nr:LemA family protein [Nitrososphaera sp.]